MAKPKLFETMDRLYREAGNAMGHRYEDRDDKKFFDRVSAHFPLGYIANLDASDVHALDISLLEAVTDTGTEVSIWHDGQFLKIRLGHSLTLADIKVARQEYHVEDFMSQFSERMRKKIWPALVGVGQCAFVLQGRSNLKDPDTQERVGAFCCKVDEKNQPTLLFKEQTETRDQIANVFRVLQYPDYLELNASRRK